MINKLRLDSRFKINSSYRFLYRIYTFVLFLFFTIPLERWIASFLIVSFCCRVIDTAMICSAFFHFGIPTHHCAEGIWRPFQETSIIQLTYDVFKITTLVALMNDSSKPFRRFARLQRIATSYKPNIRLKYGTNTFSRGRISRHFLYTVITTFNEPLRFVFAIYQGPVMSRQLFLESLVKRIA